MHPIFIHLFVAHPQLHPFLEITIKTFTTNDWMDGRRSTIWATIRRTNRLFSVIQRDKRARTKTEAQEKNARGSRRLLSCCSIPFSRNSRTIARGGRAAVATVRRLQRRGGDRRRPAIDSTAG